MAAPAGSKVATLSPPIFRVIVGTKSLTGAVPRLWTRRNSLMCAASVGFELRATDQPDSDVTDSPADTVVAVEYVVPCVPPTLWLTLPSIPCESDFSEKPSSPPVSQVLSFVYS